MTLTRLFVVRVDCSPFDYFNVVVYFRDYFYFEILFYFENIMLPVLSELRYSLPLDVRLDIFKKLKLWGAFDKISLAMVVPLNSIGNDGTCDHSCFWETH